MGKIRTRVLGLEEEEKKQKEKQKKKSIEKKASKVKEEKRDKEEEKDEKEIDVKKKEKTKPAFAKATAGKAGKTGKKHTKAKSQVDKTKSYNIEEAVSILRKIKYANFDESVELHFNVEKTGLKGEVELPHSTGKSVRVAIVDDALIAELEKGIINFDVLITHPSFMPRLARFAKVLGPRGLMPNPKAGTISPNPGEVAKKFEKGTLRWKTEPKFPLLHQMIGKISFEEKVLHENALALIKSVGKNNIHEVFIKTTMSPSLKISIENL